MKLAGFGCSYMWGWPNGNNENSIGYQTAQLLDMKFENFARQGSGNDLIYQTLLTAHQSGKINPNDNYIMIGWSEGFRRKVFYKNKVWEIFRPHTTMESVDKEYWDQHSDALFSDYFMNTNQMYYDSLKNIIGAYHFLENYGYKYLMFDAMTILNDGQGNNLDKYKVNKFWIPQEFIDMKDSIKNYFTDLQYNHFLIDLKDVADIWPYHSKTDFHPNEYACKEYAKILRDVIAFGKSDRYPIVPLPEDYEEVDDDGNSITQPLEDNS